MPRHHVSRRAISPKESYQASLPGRIDHATETRYGPRIPRGDDGTQGS